MNQARLFPYIGQTSCLSISYEVSQVMNKYLSNNKNKKNNKPKNIFVLMIIITICIIPSFSIWAEQSETTPSLQQISEIIDSYPNISYYQADQLKKEAEKAIQYGISSEDTREIIQKSLEKDIKADSIIYILSLLNNLAEDDLPTSSLINKAKEGFAKEVSSDEIISSIREKSENLQFAKYLVDKALLEGADIIDKNKAIEILAQNLPNDIPEEDMIIDIFTEALQNNKEIEEAAGAITALSNLLSLGISATSARVVTKDLLNEGYNSEDMSILTNVITFAKKNGLSVLEINSNIIDRIRKGEDALSIEKKLIGYLKDKEKDKEMTAKKDEPSSVTNTPSVGEEVITPTQTTPEPPPEEVHPAEEPSTDEGVAPPTQTGGPDAP